MLKPFPMLGLKFTTGAIPGKKLKRKADTDANESIQRYEGKRKDCHLNEKWKTGRPWLVFLENPNIGNGLNILSIGTIPDIRSDGNKCFSGPNRFLPDLSVGLACLGISDVHANNAMRGKGKIVI
jgi:hypothetical protein